MRDWPPIHDPQVLEWLALDDEAWRAVLEQRIRGFGRRPYDAAALERALSYPWERPAGSFVLRDGEVEQVEDMEPGDRRAVVSAFARDRHPLVAFGANGAPSRLQARFAAFDDPADRAALVLTGELHGVDVGAQASPTAFGTMPGALIASPGTAVRASVLWLTPPQLAELTKAELGYRLGRLDRARFVMDEAGVAVDDLFAYVSRIGALRLDGEAVALAAIPATGRSARAMTQEQLLDVVATLALGPSARAGDVVRMCFEDMPSLAQKIAPLTWPTAVRLPDDQWTPYPVP
ncbi:MAG: hypothetical protein H0T43_01645 [Solirubrobacterales bacterium]|nr:hypothetical protein [Solirubrobacterales bacterium]